MRNRIDWVLGVALALVLGYRLYSLNTGDDLVERAISVCQSCGLSEEGVLRFIDDKARSGLSRSELFKAWEDTYEDRADLEYARDFCAGCMNSILDAAIEQRATDSSRLARS